VRAGLLLTVTEELGREDTEALKERWDSFLEERNLNAGIHGSRAWHSSQLWVRVDAHRGLIDGLVWAVLLMLAIGSVVVGVLTGSPALCVFVLVCTAATTLNLAAVIFVWMNWDLGFVESIAFLAFIGQSCTSCLHVGHAYACAKPPPSEEVGADGWEISSLEASKKEASWRTRCAVEAALPRVVGSALLTAIAPTPLTPPWCWKPDSPACSH